jgi:hypothetical protein
MARAIAWLPATASPHPRPLHIIRGEETAWCGKSSAMHRTSEPQVIDPMPASAPEGMLWCPACIGYLAARCGLLDEVAESLAGYDPDLWCDPYRAERERRRAVLLAGQRSGA